MIRTLTDANRDDELDGEAFYRLILMTRSIAVSRPLNLIKFSECLTSAINESHSLPAAIELTTFGQPMDITSSQSCQELGRQLPR